MKADSVGGPLIRGEIAYVSSDMKRVASALNPEKKGPTAALAIHESQTSPSNRRLCLIYLFTLTPYTVPKTAVTTLGNTNSMK